MENKQSIDSLDNDVIEKFKVHPTTLAELNDNVESIALEEAKVR